LGLNVASSRLILSQGDAGRVIEAFGTFLIRGEVMVGIIIFSIVTIVNFIVISKGAARVSEVAARFALDSLPGKQAAIDNDARAGVLSADEARRKRDELRRDSQLYGSMDGAMKFVQGDAVAGFFIILTNIFGGVYLGLSGGMSLADAVQSYTVLTVGDGLVTQIPGLLTSICAGIIVTRVSSNDTATLSADLRQQLFSNPGMLLVTATIVLVFALLPGVPSAPFLIVAGICAALGGATLWRRRQGRALGANDAGFGQLERLPAAAGVAGELDLEDRGFLLQLDARVLFRAYRTQSLRWQEWWRAFQAEFVQDVGVVLPEVRVVADDLLGPGSFCVTSAGVSIVHGQVPADAVLVEVSSPQAALLGFQSVCDEEHPVSGNRVFWCRNTAGARKMLEAASIRSFDPFEYIGLRLGAFCRRHPQEFLSVTDVHSLLRQVEKRHPGLIGEGFGKAFVSVPVLTEILQELVVQGVSIRDFRGILESIAAYCSSCGVSLEQEQQVDVAAAVHFVRVQRRRQIVRRYLGPNQSLRVIALSADVQAAFEDAEISPQGSALAIAPLEFEGLVAGLTAAVRPVLEMGVVPVAILCGADLRAKVITFLRSTLRPLFVVSFEELDPFIPVEQVGVWSSADPRP
jgi:type III secretion protein V